MNSKYSCDGQMTIFDFLKENKIMNVLVACEESQTVCKAFRAKGHRAFSADIQECSGGHPEWHILGDVVPIINGRTTFKTQDGETHYISGKWDLIIAHPPCTYLTVTGNRWFNVEKYGQKAIEREREREEAARFFMNFVNADCEKIVIENPIGCMSKKFRKADQIIQPFQYGHKSRKATCLWIKGLDHLKPTQIVEPEIVTYICKNGKKISQSADYGCGYGKEKDSKRRSKTYEGIAKAMANQWG